MEEKKTREIGECPIGLHGDNVPPREAVSVHGELREGVDRYEISRLVVGKDVAEDFEILGLTVDGAETKLKLQEWQSTSSAIAYEVSATLRQGKRASLRIRNVKSVPRPFHAALIGVVHEKT